MDQFIAKHADAIEGTLSCFARLIFRGCLPFFSGYAMAAFLESKQVHRWALKRFLIEQAERRKTHARRMAEAAGRPCEYLPGASDKDALARALAKRDGIEQGLAGIYSVVEPCRTFSLSCQQRHYVQSAKPKCLSLYDSFMDPDLGLLHVKVQTWFPLQLQLSVNGHEWLARKLTRHGIRSTKLDNTFFGIEDFARAQTFADRSVTVGWVDLLQRYARRVQPPAGRSARPEAVLLGDGPSRGLHRPGVQEPRAAARPGPAALRTQHALLRRAGCAGLPRAQAPRDVRGRGADRPPDSGDQRAPPGPSRQTSPEAELDQDGRQGRSGPPD